MTHLSLKTCEALKAVGMPQETVFWYVENQYGDGFSLKMPLPKGGVARKFACPTIEEMLEMLGQRFIGMALSTIGYAVYGRDTEYGTLPTKHVNSEANDSPAEALAQLLLEVRPWN